MLLEVNILVTETEPTKEKIEKMEWWIFNVLGRWKDSYQNLGIRLFIMLWAGWSGFKSDLEGQRNERS